MDEGDVFSTLGLIYSYFYYSLFKIRGVDCQRGQLQPVGVC